MQSPGEKFPFLIFSRSPGPGRTLFTGLGDDALTSTERLFKSDMSYDEFPGLGFPKHVAQRFPLLGGVGEGLQIHDVTIRTIRNWLVLNGALVRIETDNDLP